MRPPPFAPGDVCACVRAQRVKRVVGDESSPDQRPQRVDRLGRIAAADGFVNRTEERRAVCPEVIENGGFARTLRQVRLKPDATYVRVRLEPGIFISRRVRLRADVRL